MINHAAVLDPAYEEYDSFFGRGRWVMAFDPLTHTYRRRWAYDIGRAPQPAPADVDLLKSDPVDEEIRQQESLEACRAGQRKSAALMRQHSIAKIIAAIKQHGPMRQDDLARVAQLGKATISDALRDRPDLFFVVDYQCRKRLNGRVARVTMAYGLVGQHEKVKA